MLKNVFSEYWNMNDNELANHYLDLCAYSNPVAIKKLSIVINIMIERFIDKYADRPEDNINED